MSSNVGGIFNFVVESSDFLSLLMSLFSHWTVRWHWSEGGEGMYKYKDGRENSNSFLVNKAFYGNIDSYISFSTV